MQYACSKDGRCEMTAGAGVVTGDDWGQRINECGTHERGTAPRNE
jgi:hypothetical protein